MNARQRGGAGTADDDDMGIEVDMDTIPSPDISDQFTRRGLVDGLEDAVIMEQVKKRKMGLKVLQQYPWTETLATIPDASSPQAKCDCL